VAWGHLQRGRPQRFYQQDLYEAHEHEVTARVLLAGFLADEADQRREPLGATYATARKRVFARESEASLSGACRLYARGGAVASDPS
jgi:hypothetical protein